MKQIIRTIRLNEDQYDLVLQLVDAERVKALQDVGDPMVWTFLDRIRPTEERQLAYNYLKMVGDLIEKLVKAF